MPRHELSCTKVAIIACIHGGERKVTRAVAFVDVSVVWAKAAERRKSARVRVRVGKLATNGRAQIIPRDYSRRYTTVGKQFFFRIFSKNAAPPQWALGEKGQAYMPAKFQEQATLRSKMPRARNSGKFALSRATVSAFIAFFDNF